MEAASLNLPAEQGYGTAKSRQPTGRSRLWLRMGLEGQDPGCHDAAALDGIGGDVLGVGLAE